MPAAELHALLTAIAEIIEGNVFTVVDDERTLAELATVEDIASKRGVAMPAAHQFPNQSFVDRHGWGNRPTDSELLRWRTLS